MKDVTAPSLPAALALSSRVLRMLIPINLLIGALILALLIAGFIDRDGVFGALGVDLTTGGRGLIAGARVIMVVGIAAVACTHRVFEPLQGIVETVRNGNPFAAENAARLKGIAWAVLGLEVLRTINAFVAAGISTPTTQINIGWDLNFTRWLTVLLLFVLAGVFEHGARMRDDLEGTV
jgi:hypothetical protein